jgi:hypothetical protein
LWRARGWRSGYQRRRPSEASRARRRRGGPASGDDQRGARACGESPQRMRDRRRHRRQAPIAVGAVERSPEQTAAGPCARASLACSAQAGKIAASQSQRASRICAERTSSRVGLPVAMEQERTLRPLSFGSCPQGRSRVGPGLVRSVMKNQQQRAQHRLVPPLLNLSSAEVRPTRCCSETEERPPESAGHRPNQRSRRGGPWLPLSSRRSLTGVPGLAGRGGRRPPARLRPAEV